MTELMETTERDQSAERRRLEAIWWAGALIWIGLILGAEYLEILPEIGERTSLWPWIFVGVGPWALGMNLYRTLSETAPKPNTWDWVWTTVFMLAALGALADIGGEILGAVVLVAVGLIFMWRAVRRAD